MASAVIHLCVANEISKKFKRNNFNVLIGSIAPDIAKIIGESKIKSHFQIKNDDLPNLNLFLKKYLNNLNDDFVFGYFIHLCTDYLWFKYFLKKYVDDEYIYLKNKEKVKFSDELLTNYVYSDYTNLNCDLIDNYNLSLDIFEKEIPKLNNIIKEIPMDKIYLVVDKTETIIKNSKRNSINLFDLEDAKKFITFSVEIIIKYLGVIYGNSCIRTDSSR